MIFELLSNIYLFTEAYERNFYFFQCCSQARYRAIHWRVATEPTTPVLWERYTSKAKNLFWESNCEKGCRFWNLFLLLLAEIVSFPMLWHVCMLLLIIKFKGLYCFIFCIIIDANIVCFVLYWPLCFNCWFICFLLFCLFEFFFIHCFADKLKNCKFCAYILVFEIFYIYINFKSKKKKNK